MLDKNSKLAQALENALDNINTDGEIPAKYHREIYLAIALIANDSGEELSSKSLIASIELACVNKVSYLAVDRLDVFTNISILLENGQKIIKETATDRDKEEIESINCEFPSVLEDLTDEGEENLITSYVGWACISAINTALYGMAIEPIGIPETQPDPDLWSAAYYASVAFSGGGAWESTGDKLKRKEFWLWYLTELIPSLFNDDRIATPNL